MKNMNLDSFIIDTSTCIVELKNEVPMAFYETMDGVSFSILIEKVDEMFVNSLERKMTANEKQFVQLLFWQCVGKPHITFFSLLEQWMYWLPIDWKRVEMFADEMMEEGENDES